MRFTQIGKIVWGQDGSIWGGYLFRFGNHGECFAYDLAEMKANGEKESSPVCTFTLDKADILSPHSNSVSFGKEYFEKNDEFPLLYTNIYNNYANAENQRKGVTCVYRLQRNGREFSSTLVQTIEIGFVEDAVLWKSTDGDIRPYGNFAIDKENGVYYAFTMRDESQTTRYFSFALPTLKDGVYDEKSGVNKVVLQASDIQSYFDCEYHRFMQGACLHDGKIYSVEGFTHSPENPAALRVIDLQAQKQARFVDLVALGFAIEPEFIEFYEGVCYYSDGHGNVYEVDFEE